MTKERLQRLVEVGRSLISELDLDAVLKQLLGVAREVTGARYAAVGVLDERRQSLERFVTAGIDPEVHRAIGELPRGRGVLGVLIDDPRPLRLEDVGEHPRSYGFPPAHPAMKSFLGVPIVIRGEAWGNLYLAESAGGEFSEEDEQAMVVLADWAAIAIDNARLYRGVLARRNELEQANRGLATTLELARVLGGETDLDRVLELVVKRSRALVDARSAMIELIDGNEFEIVAVAGHDVGGLRGTRTPVAGSLGGQALDARRVLRFEEIPLDTAVGRQLGTRAAIVAPMIFRGRTLGVLGVFDGVGARGRFTAEHDRLLDAFATSAATAVATAQTMANEALRRSMRASEQERQRWARELHDETLQELAGLRLLLSGAQRSGDADRLRAAVAEALEQITRGIENLRALITDLRPAALDQLGTGAALQALAERVKEQAKIEVDLDVDLDYEAGRSPARHAPDLEAAIYRLVQEAVTNAVKHASPSRIAIAVADRDGKVHVAVRDDGVGFDQSAPAGGFGVIGMRERVALAGGTLEIESAPGAGTVVTAELPAHRDEPVARVA